MARTSAASTECEQARRLAITGEVCAPMLPLRCSQRKASCHCIILRRLKVQSVAPLATAVVDGARLYDNKADPEACQCSLHSPARSYRIIRKVAVVFLTHPTLPRTVCFRHNMQGTTFFSTEQLLPSYSNASCPILAIRRAGGKKKETRNGELEELLPGN